MIVLTYEEASIQEERILIETIRQTVREKQKLHMKNLIPTFGILLKNT